MPPLWSSVKFILEYSTYYNALFLTEVQLFLHSKKFYFFSKLDDLKVQISVLDKKSLKQCIFACAF